MLIFKLTSFDISIEIVCVKNKNTFPNSTVEQKSEARVSKFDLSPIFLATMLLHNLRVFLETNKTSFASYSLIPRAHQILTYEHQMLI